MGERKAGTEFTMTLPEGFDPKQAHVVSQWPHDRPLNACRFDPTRLQCAGAKDANCLTSAQVGALERAFGGPRNSSGRTLYVGQAWDPGIAAPGWRQWKLGSSQTGTPNAANATLMAGALAHEFFTPPDPAFTITRFDFDRDPARMEAVSLPPASAWSSP